MKLIRKILTTPRRFSQNFYHHAHNAMRAVDVAPFLGYIFIANILDAGLSLQWIKMNVAEEANPLMAHLIDIDSRLFLAVKISLITLSCIILWRFGSHGAAKVFTILAAILYTAILGIHLIGAFDAGILAIPSQTELKERLLELWNISRQWISLQIARCYT